MSNVCRVDATETRGFLGHMVNDGRKKRTKLRDEVEKVSTTMPMSLCYQRHPERGRTLTTKITVTNGGESR